MFSEFFADDILGSLKCNVCDEKGITWRTLLVPILLSTIRLLASGARKVDIESTVVNHSSMHSLLCFDPVLRIDELDIAKPVTV